MHKDNYVHKSLSRPRKVRGQVNSMQGETALNIIVFKSIPGCYTHIYYKVKMKNYELFKFIPP